MASDKQIRDPHADDLLTPENSAVIFAGILFEDGEPDARLHDCRRAREATRLVAPFGVGGGAAETRREVRPRGPRPDG